jgi:hypothetical protein
MSSASSGQKLGQVPLRDCDGRCDTAYGEPIPCPARTVLRRRACGWAVALLILLAGCRDAPSTTHPVTGRLTIRGQPAAEADLRFYEISGKAAGMARPYARTDENGQFTASTYGMRDGAPAGEYQVSVSWKGPLRGIPPDQRDAMPELLPPRYADPATSGIRVRVAPGDNALETIDLTP